MTVRELLKKDLGSQLVDYDGDLAHVRAQDYSDIKRRLTARGWQSRRPARRRKANRISSLVGAFFEEEFEKIYNGRLARTRIFWLDCSQSEIVYWFSAPL